MSRPDSKSRLFRYTKWDALNVAVIPLHVMFFIWLAQAYDKLSLSMLLGISPLFFLISLQNAGANHNHFHTPFFRSRSLNALTRIGFSATASPKTPYNIGHGVHHSDDRSWNNESILEILGLKRPIYQQLLAFFQYAIESLGLKYLILLYLMKRKSPEKIANLANPSEVEIATRVFQKLQSPRKLREAKLDLFAWMFFRTLLCIINWKFFFFYFVPISFLVDTVRTGENYLQHWGASDPDDPKRDSVSCYNPVYNILTFNLGYHQEHHYSPGTHWLRLPDIKSELPDDRRVVPVSHYINLPIFYPMLFAKLSK